MLISLHVKNFAIINEVEVDFKNHLNIMTGETGAGKSIIIGSVNAALGAKMGKDIVRSGADYALVELIFETKAEAVLKAMRELDIPVEGDQIIISRKIMSGRSVCKINGENVTASALSAVAGLLIDIHGQHEHQSLLNKSKHLEIVDRFARDELGELKADLEQGYKEYSKLKQESLQAGMDEDKRLREISFLEYEVTEIKNAALIPGEDEELSVKYKKLSNANAISEGLQSVYRYTGYDPSAAGDAIGRALRQLQKLSEFDGTISGFLNQLSEIDGLMNDLNRDLSQYMAGVENPEEELEEVTKRLDLINHLKSKYGNSIDQITSHCRECEEKLEKYRDYDLYVEKLAKKLSEAEARLDALSQRLSDIRKSKAKELTGRIKEALVALNFLDVQFEMTFERLQHYTAGGFDDAEFIISTNPGEGMKPLSRVASGGELSRIMLGIKSVLADKDEIETLIFDEIDVGISGRTAQKVSEQLSSIAGNHQIICITHLAQIAAMADAHYVIEKQTDGISTQTLIRELKEEEMIDELSRILGGAQITERVRENAKEMKELAYNSKKYKL
ncbi:MAG TPA: DNA repair protein RecN [Clostridiales bacterium]|nr:DNA repair protein RecN [Clostridiales bacterium]